MTAEQLLADLAAVWVDRWLKYGGGLECDVGSNVVTMSWRCDNWRRKPRGPEPWRKQDAVAFEMWNVGRWRELQELCREVPGLHDAIVDYIASHGSKLGDGRAQMAALVY